ncbi:MAG: hypothetical protein QXX15_02210 [Desulfurococcaceae archaeon]
MSIFKPLNILLCSYNSKLKVPLNLPQKREASYAILEILVEASRVYPSWKVKLGNVGITREFKPAFGVAISSQDRHLYKFIYDVTDILRATATQYGEGIDLTIKYEGGTPFRVLGLILDSIYSDADAETKYKHYTGLIGIEPMKSLELNLEESFEPSSTLRIIAYTASPARISILSGEEAGVHDLSALVLDEVVVKMLKATRSIKVSLERSERSSPLVISSVTIYRSEVKAPHLDLCSVNREVGLGEVKLELEICNHGYSRPDKLIISFIRRGELIRTLHEDGRELEPNARIRREVRLPLNLVQPGKEIVVRLIWTKLSRHWVIDKSITI